MQAAIYGLEGPELSESERSFFREAEPAGFIVFRRNCEASDQLVRLTNSLRDLTGRDDVPILIDQELDGAKARAVQPVVNSDSLDHRFRLSLGHASSPAVRDIAEVG